MHKLLTEKERHKLSAFVLIVGVAVMPMSLSLIGTTIYIRFVVDEELDLVQGMHTAVLPYYLATTGTINFLACLLLLTSMVGVHQPSSRLGSLRMLLISIIIYLVATVLIFSSFLFCIIQMALLPNQFEEGLSSALQQYGKVPSVKTRMDIMQMEYECCGDKGYADWFTVPWISPEYLVVDPKEVKFHFKDGPAYINDDVPFSCCDSASPRPCIHHHVTTDHLHYKYDHRTNTTLLTNGCRQVLMDFFGHTVLRAAALALFFMFVAQVVILGVSRLLQTSMMGALESGDLSASAEGYLFKPPPGGTPADAEKQALLEEGTTLSGSRPSDEGTGLTSETEEETEPDTASSEDEAAAGIIQRASPDRPTDASLEGEPLYENVIPVKPSDDEEMLEDENQEAPWEPEDEEGQGQQAPLFPSEMADRAENNSWHNSAFARVGARRPLVGGRGSTSSKAFNSLGISPPQPPPQHQHAAIRQGIVHQPRDVPPPRAPPGPFYPPPHKPVPVRPQYSSYHSPWPQQS